MGVCVWLEARVGGQSCSWPGRGPGSAERLGGSAPSLSNSLSPSWHPPLWLGVEPATIGVSIKYYYQHYNYRFKTQLPGTVVMLNLFSIYIVCVLAERSFDKSNTSLNIVHKTLNILYINKYIKNALTKINTKSCL